MPWHLNRKNIAIGRTLKKTCNQKNDEIKTQDKMIN